MRRIVRHRLFWGTLAIVLATVGTLGLRGRIADLDAQRAAWGSTREVLVVTAPVDAGSPIGDNVERRALPAAVVPEFAIDAAGADATSQELPDDALARTALVVGEILLESRVTTSSHLADPTSDTFDTVAMGVRVGAEAPELRLDDLVDVWAVDRSGVAAQRVLSRAPVLRVDGERVTLAVPTEDAEALALAAAVPVTIAIVGWR